MAKSSSADASDRSLSADIASTERSFHFTADLYRRIARIVDDIRPLQRLALGDIGFELHIVRKPERQQFAVEHFAGLQGTLGRRHDVRVKSVRRAGRLVA